MPGPEDQPRKPEPSYGPAEDGEFLTDLDEDPVDPEEPGVETKPR